jgi:hypothetical protein
MIQTFFDILICSFAVNSVILVALHAHRRVVSL